MTVSVELEVANPTGLHARPAALSVRTAAGYASEISIANLARGGGEVSARSLIHVLGLGVQRGDRLRLRIDGPDEAAAAAALCDLFAAGLGEGSGDGAAEP